MWAKSTIQAVRLLSSQKWAVKDTSYISRTDTMIWTVLKHRAEWLLLNSATSRVLPNFSNRGLEHSVGGLPSMIFAMTEGPLGSLPELYGNYDRRDCFQILTEWYHILKICSMFTHLLWIFFLRSWLQLLQILKGSVFSSLRLVVQVVFFVQLWMK